MTTFLIIGAVGVVLVLVTLVVGDILDGVLHLDALDSDLFSISSLAAFIGAFGFGGAIGLGVLHNMVLAVIVGLIIGSLAAWGAVSLTKKLKSDGASFRSDSMIGHPGRVITAIPEGGYGEITISVAGHVRKITAKAEQAIDSGTEVWVSAILSPTAVEVTPTSGPHELIP
ncbi:hypothetical protein [Tessaracoccus flavus]|uniref:Uncharacterized protein n=1 Tax=Tessaracoccus flavus TaxID=1610493 RepID=A0A1Q2CGG7_9ACTN|nr:hypothetical protein [Tessaracoccus flavus]AQP45197.1 hypothetical protein RPIT_10650 [Tessaracoccus flavus]SDY53378.1 hypothetical protein SAMN05428934_102175 [Tessaracoccus flavus]